MRPGTEANQAPMTQMTLQLCIMSGVAFQCHDGGDGHLCKGFHDAFVAKLNRGDYAAMPEWKRRLAVESLAMIDEAKDADARGVPFDADAAMQKMIEKLCDEVPGDAR
jgi:hypothetical protein